ncbi:hypothetical protein GBA52_018742 [Prunus armeniaca]|nr:hypothetical protein GBA52_018742 [Prunus armeniaca]
MYLKYPQLRTKLKKSWPDVEDGNDTKFWEGEWRKHGTCSEQTLNQMQYFEVSQDMWRSHNITEILKNASIVPHPTQTWKYSDIESPIKTATKRTPILRCKRDPAWNKTGPRTQLLHEVVFCYGYNAKKHIDFVFLPVNTLMFQLLLINLYSNHHTLNITMREKLYRKANSSKSPKLFWDVNLKQTLYICMEGGVYKRWDSLILPRKRRRRRRLQLAEIREREGGVGRVGLLPRLAAWSFLSFLAFFF